VGSQSLESLDERLHAALDKFVDNNHNPHLLAAARGIGPDPEHLTSRLFLLSPEGPSEDGRFFSVVELVSSYVAELLDQTLLHADAKVQARSKLLFTNFPGGKPPVFTPVDTCSWYCCR
jgi:hypothetical protein